MTDQWASFKVDDDSDDEGDRADPQRALCHAAGIGDVASLSDALDGGARIDGLDEAGFGAMHRASAYGRWDEHLRLHVEHGRLVEPVVAPEMGGL